MCPLCPTLPGKAIKLSFSTSLRTISEIRFGTDVQRSGAYGSAPAHGVTQVGGPEQVLGSPTSAQGGNRGPDVTSPTWVVQSPKQLS